MRPFPKLPSGIAPALLAALLFGASTPLAKLLLDDVPPVLLAGLLYAGSGLGLGTWWLARRMQRGEGTAAEAPLQKRDLPWLAGAVITGGVLGPVLLMMGLFSTPASSASLLLNLESVITALLAWMVFRENVDLRIFLGMVAIVGGGVLLAWTQVPTGLPWGALAIGGACACWAIDNNLTRVVSGGDPVQVAAIKGGVAGAINIGAASFMGQRLPDLMHVLSAGAIGLTGYGISLVAFVLALRHLGAARTGAYFSTAPFVGAALSLLLLRELPGPSFWIAGSLMALGVWLHVSEHHEHEHTHEVIEHEHLHAHDEHHQHAHDAGWDGSEPHSHPHRHEPMTHTHPHYPDLHHRHGHG
jgi:drug/metabolite transporter (DMT)-like permease